MENYIKNLVDITYKSELTPPFWAGKESMHYVYLIQSLKLDNIYVGNTNDLEKRLSQHNNGYNEATKRYAPYRLIYYEAYLDKDDALNREYKLKHHGSVIGHLKNRLKNSLIKPAQKGGV
jgi:putative endonuclease